MEFHPAGPLPGENKNIDKGCAAAMEDILKMESISKNFYGVYALKNVSFNVKKEKYTRWWEKMGQENPH